MPIIAKREFISRRKRLMQQVPERSLLIVPGASLSVRSADTHYPFRQHSDFLYLTGFSEPDAVLVMMRGRAAGETLMFSVDADANYQQWHGQVMNPDMATSSLGVDHGFGIDALSEIVEGLVESADQIIAPLDHPNIEQWLPSWQALYGEQVSEKLKDIRPYIADLRLVKSAAEQRVMATSAAISASAINSAIKATRPGMFEYQLAASLHHTYQWHGAEAAYPPIVAGGKNGQTLHYINNDSELRAGDLLLVDAGCEVEGYACDITRTWPVNGQYLPAQRAVYELVLAANEAGINEVQAGQPFNAAHLAAAKTICYGLVNLGLIEGPADEAYAQQRYKRYYMHATGHWIGLDVHDVGEYQVAGESPLLEAGMTVTVEPGIYIAHDDSSVAAKWRGIYIRIEDTVLVTQGQPKVLSEAAIKRPDHIEQAMLEVIDAPV